jgi:hypothetical protein
MIKAKEVLLLELAYSQIGYKETGTNITKYAKYFDTEAWQWFNSKKQGAAWCAIFICWLYCQIYGPEQALKILGCPKPSQNCAAGVPYLLKYLKAKGYHVHDKTKGQAGDIIFFNDNTHVGLIYEVKNDKYITIEGNAGNKVAKKAYVLNSKKISAICRVKTEEPAKDPTPVKNPERRCYTVKKGDTMSKIARSLGVSLYYLKKHNPQITNINLIYPGQKVYY